MKPRILIHFTALLVLLAGNSFAQSPVSTTTADIPTVAYCDLIRNPSLYDHQVIRTKAYYVGGFEVSGLEDQRCDSRRSVHVAFDEPYKSHTKKSVLEDWDRIFNSPHVTKDGGRVRADSGRAEVIIVGEFQSPPRPIDRGDEEYEIGWKGGDKYQFIIQSIEDVKSASRKKR
jgi:hypothetical protein